jgi:hypothetical protein
MINNYAIIENNIVVNAVVADEVYAESQGWVLLTNGAGIGWSYIDGVFYPPIIPQPTSEQIQAQNKQRASTLLLETDWTATVDISNPQYSNPYLANQDEFLAYRSSVRAIALNPPTTSVEFPTLPVEVWA